MNPRPATLLALTLPFIALAAGLWLRFERPWESPDGPVLHGPRQRQSSEEVPEVVRKGEQLKSCLVVLDLTTG